MSRVLVIPQDATLDEESGVLQLCIDGVAQFTSAGIPVPLLMGAEGNEDDDEEDDDDDDDTEGGTEGGAAGDKGKDDKSKSGDSDPTSGLKSALEKQKELRRKAREERDAARAELDQFKNKDLPELEQVKTERDAAVAERDTLKADLGQAQVELAFLKADAGISWHDPEDALVHVRKELGDLIDDDEIDLEQVKTIATDLAKRKPYLVKSDATDDGKGKGKKTKEQEQDPNSDGNPEGSTAGGGKGKKERNGSKTFTDAQLRDTYPALRK